MLNVITRYTHKRLRFGLIIPVNSLSTRQDFLHLVLLRDCVLIVLKALTTLHQRTIVDAGRDALKIKFVQLAWFDPW